MMWSVNPFSDGALLLVGNVVVISLCVFCIAGVLFVLNLLSPIQCVDKSRRLGLIPHSLGGVIRRREMLNENNFASCFFAEKFFVPHR